jgi:hypothetical protein
MATVTLTTTADQDAAVQYYADQYNARMSPPVPLTPRDFAMMRIQELLDGLVARATDERRINKGTLYNRATSADQATIDAILQKYA